MNPLDPHAGNGTGAPPTSAASGPAAGNDNASANPDRDNRGRFCKNNKGGPGNPFARRTAALRQAMLDAVTAEDLQAIVRQLLQKAKEGDLSAARLVLSYAIGKPDKAVDPDTLDQQEWLLWQQEAVAGDDFLPLVGGMQAPLACALLRALIPPIQESLGRNFSQQCRDSLSDQQRAEPAAAQTAPVAPPEPAPRPRPATSKPERSASAERKEPAPTPKPAGSARPADRSGNRELWQKVLQTIFRRTGDAQRPEVTDETQPPIPNGSDRRRTR